MTRVVGAFVLAAIVLSAATASAADPKSRAAEQRFNEGVRLLRAHDYEAARQRFADAYNVIPSVDILWNLALCELKTGHYVEAIVHFRDYVDDPDARAERKARASSEFIPQAHAKTGHVKFVNLPSDVKVRLDNKSVEDDDLATEADATPGKHTLEFRRGDKLQTVEVELKAGEVYSVATPDFSAKTGASETAAEASTKEKPEEDPFKSEAEEAQKSAPPSSPRAVGTAVRTWAVASLGALALASAATGAYFSYSAYQDGEHAAQIQRSTNRPPCIYPTSKACEDLTNASRSEAVNKSFATGFFITGGVLLVGAGAAWLFWPSDSGGNVTGLTPTLGPKSVGMQWSGQF